MYSPGRIFGLTYNFSTICCIFMHLCVMSCRNARLSYLSPYDIPDEAAIPAGILTPREFPHFETVMIICPPVNNVYLHWIYVNTYGTSGNVPVLVRMMVKASPSSMPFPSERVTPHSLVRIRQGFPKIHRIPLFMYRTMASSLSASM